MEVTYTEQGGFRLPDLMLPAEKPRSYGKYGIIRLNYLKQRRRGLYINLLTTCKLNDHLCEVDELTRKAVEELVNAMAGLCGVNEELKARDQMEWCGQMNAIKHQAEEIAMRDYIFD